MTFVSAFHALSFITCLALRNDYYSQIPEVGEIVFCDAQGQDARASIFSLPNDIPTDHATCEVVISYSGIFLVRIGDLHPALAVGENIYSLRKRSATLRLELLVWQLGRKANGNYCILTRR